MALAIHTQYTDLPEKLAESNYIIAAPTPVNQAHFPDFSTLLNASAHAGQQIILPACQNNSAALRHSYHENDTRRGYPECR